MTVEIVEKCMNYVLDTQWQGLTEEEIAARKEQIVAQRKERRQKEAEKVKKEMMEVRKTNKNSFLRKKINNFPANAFNKILLLRLSYKNSCIKFDAFSLVNFFLQKQGTEKHGTKKLQFLSGYNF